MGADVAVIKGDIGCQAMALGPQKFIDQTIMLARAPRTRMSGQPQRAMIWRRHCARKAIAKLGA